MKLYHHMHKLWLLTLLDKHKVYKLAANEAQLTQSALSQNILNLEKTFGKPLVEKKKTGIELTPFAKNMVSSARPIFDSIDKLHSEEDETSGTVSIGAYDSLAVNFLSLVIPELHKEFPQAKFQVTNGSSSTILNLVKNGTLDFGLIIDSGTETNLEKTHLGNIELGLYINKKFSDKDHTELIKQSGIVSLDLDLLQAPAYFQSFYKMIPFEYSINMAFSSFESIMTLIEKTEHIGVLPNILGDKNPNLFKLWEDNSHANGSHHPILVSRSMVRSEIKKRLGSLLSKELG